MPILAVRNQWYQPHAAVFTGGGGGGGGSVSFTYTSGEADTTSGGLSTITFNNGGAHHTFTAGFNIVAFAPAVGGPVTSMTLGPANTSATFLGTAGGDSWAVEMWGATVGAGSGDVVVNLTGTSFGSVMAFGVLSGSSNTVAASATLNSPTTFTASQGTTSGLTLSAGDLAVIAVSGQQGTYPAATWSNATNVGFVNNSRPATMNMATMSSSGTPTVTNYLNQNGSILALKFTP